MNYYYSHKVWVPWDIGVESVRQSVCLQRISFFFCCSFLIIQRPQTNTFSASRDNSIPIQFDFIEQFSFDIFIISFSFVWLGPSAMVRTEWSLTIECELYAECHYSAASRYSLFFRFPFCSHLLRSAFVTMYSIVMHFLFNLYEN